MLNNPDESGRPDYPNMLDRSGNLDGLDRPDDIDVSDKLNNPYGPVCLSSLSIYYIIKN